MVFVDDTRNLVRFDSTELYILHKCASFITHGSAEEFSDIEKAVIASWEGAINSLCITNESRLINQDGKFVTL